MNWMVNYLLLIIILLQNCNYSHCMNKKQNEDVLTGVVGIFEGESGIMYGKLHDSVERVCAKRLKAIGDGNIFKLYDEVQSFIRNLKLHGVDIEQCYDLELSDDFNVLDKYVWKNVGCKMVPVCKITEWQNTKNEVVRLQNALQKIENDNENIRNKIAKQYKQLQNDVTSAQRYANQHKKALNDIDAQIKQITNNLSSQVTSMQQTLNTLQTENNKMQNEFDKYTDNRVLQNLKSEIHTISYNIFLSHLLGYR